MRIDSFKLIQKNKNNKKLFLFFILLLSSLMVAIVIECFIFNLKNIVKPNLDVTISEIEYENFKKKSDSEIVGTSNVGTVKLKFKESYIKNFKYKMDLIENKAKEIGYKVIINGKDRLNFKDDFFSRQFGVENKSITLNETTSEIEIVFSDVKDSVIKMSDFSIHNYFEFNVIRFFVILFFVLFFFYFIMFNFFDLQIEIFAPTIILCSGLILSFLIPPHHTWDEYSHFIKSYSVASGSFFLTNNSNIDYPKGLDQIDYNSNLEYNSLDDYKEVKLKLKNVKRSTSENKVIESTAIINLFLPYLPSALGMRIAMTFNLPIYFYIYFGRMMNILLYSLLMFLSLKITPIGKRLIGFYGMLPINVFLASSLSCDFMAMGCLMLALSISFNILSNKKMINLNDFFVLLLLYSCATISKVSYAPFFLLMFLFKSSSFSNRNKMLLFRVSVLVSCFFIALATYLYADKLGIVQWSREGVDSSLQLLGILKNPINYITMIIKFVSDNSVNYITNMFSFFAYIGNISQIYVLITVISIFFLAWFDLPNISKRREFSFYLDKFSKVIIILTSMGGIVLSLTALYISFTPVGSQTVDGFQGRYFLPLIFPMLFLFRNKKLHSPFSRCYLERMVLLSTLVLYFPLLITIISSYYNS